MHSDTADRSVAILDLNLQAAAKGTACKNTKAHRHSFGATALSGAGGPSHSFLDHTDRRTTVGRTPLYE